MNFSNVKKINIPEGNVIKIMDSNGVVIWKKGNGEPDLPIPLSNEIYYTSTDGNIVELSSDYSGVQPISNTYENGIGKMVFEKDLMEIDEYAFDSCTSLQSMVIPNSIKYIDSFAFYNCTSLQSIVLPNSVTTIFSSAFYKCTSLQSVKIPNGVKGISQAVFADCYSLQNIVIPDSVTYIGEYSFSDCTSLQSIVIPEFVTEIDVGAFSNCYFLQNIICKPIECPKSWDNTFENVGSKVPEGQQKILYIPQDSTGYDALLKYSLNGFTKEYITE